MKFTDADFRGAQYDMPVKVDGGLNHLTGVNQLRSAELREMIIDEAFKQFVPRDLIEKLAAKPIPVVNIERIPDPIPPKCVDCGATEKLANCDADHTRCIYCYARRSENTAGFANRLSLRFKDCTPAAKMEPEVVTCDLGVDYE